MTADTDKPRMGKMHLVQDAASRHKLALRPAASIPGKEVARNLNELFEEHEPPLVAKRDNGSNLNYKEVDEVLRRHLMIPLNFPPHYPRYNGGLERGQREVEEVLEQLPPPAEEPQGVSVVAREREELARRMVEELDHSQRPCLKGRTLFAVFSGGQEWMKRYNLRRWKEALARIKQLFGVILGEIGRRTKRAVDSAWRQTVKTWLLEEGIIEVIGGKSVTWFSSVLIS